MREVLLASAMALVEQSDVASVDLNFLQWIDCAVPWVGWESADALDSSAARRCLMTQAPPWRFPSKSLCPCKRKEESIEKDESMQKDRFVETRPGVTESETPYIAVFISDPRLMVMKELIAANTMGLQKGIDLTALLTEMLKNDLADTRGMGLFGNSLRAALGWAQVEAMNPDRIRIFFTEDFTLQPEVAMRGLAKFLRVPGVTTATDTAVKEAARLIRSASDEVPNTLIFSPCQFLESMQMDNVESLVTDFEKQLAAAPEELQVEWRRLMEDWLESPNAQMVAYANTVLRHEHWNPPKWWVKHTARACRPCLYFPRGKCDKDDCDYCHGPGHLKPKRPPKSKRAAARRRYHRTPSPDYQAPPKLPGPSHEFPDMRVQFPR